MRWNANSQEAEPQRVLMSFVQKGEVMPRVTGGPPNQRKTRNQSIAGSKSEEFITPPGRGKERPATAGYHTEAPIQKDSPESTVKNLFGKKKKFFKTKTTKGKKILKYSVVTSAKNFLTI